MSGNVLRCRECGTRALSSDLTCAKCRAALPEVPGRVIDLPPVVRSGPRALYRNGVEQSALPLDSTAALAGFLALLSLWAPLFGLTPVMAVVVGVRAVRSVAKFELGGMGIAVLSIIIGLLKIWDVLTLLVAATALPS